MVSHLNECLSDEDNISNQENYLFALQQNCDFNPNNLAKYFKNIQKVSRHLRMTPDYEKSWKPFQYLALLLTEHYLNRFFSDAEQLCKDLNDFKSGELSFRNMNDYEVADLRTIAFQSATGSGKTLLMHAHILQYQHYIDQASEDLNNIILLTQNESMTEQHLRHLRESRIQARKFTPNSERNLFRKVEIIDLHKLAEKRGIKTVSVKEFGKKNLVLIDEGHLGFSGAKWRKLRKILSTGGFTIEYSATFNQITSRQATFRDEYGKCLLFDYSYQQFHAEGYGKDYDITNLKQGTADIRNKVYVLGYILLFYQQFRIWFDNRSDFSSFNISKPLMVFLGKTVTGESKNDKESQTDILNVIRYVSWVLSCEPEVRKLLNLLMFGQTGIVDKNDCDIFEHRFDYLRKSNIDDIYSDLCEKLFNGSGNLHVQYLTHGDGELHLFSANNPKFGVIYVGNSSKLFRLLEKKSQEKQILNTIFEKDVGFSPVLFDSIDSDDSSVNMVIGAKKFIAGWNSWRVSTIGLMNVGVGEGPEIIQIFGRGVRLKGWDFSLKRHNFCQIDEPVLSDALSVLETLNVFGLRANYMMQFKQALLNNQMVAETEIIELPVTWNFGRITNMLTLRLPAGKSFEYSDERVRISDFYTNECIVVKLKKISKVELLGDSTGFSANLGPVEIPKKITTWFNGSRIYETILRHKQLKGWWNLLIDLGTVEKLINSKDWYELTMSSEQLIVNSFGDLQRLESYMTELILLYVQEVWKISRRRWESIHLQASPISRQDPNFFETYKLTVNKNELQLIRDLEEMKNDLSTSEQYYPSLKLGTIRAENHAYEPLLYTEQSQHYRYDIPQKASKINVSPVELNANEKKVVSEFNKLPSVDDFEFVKEWFLVRNLSRGRGVSFFDDVNFYPDFIVEVKTENIQHIIFLDPKGLRHYGKSENSKVKLHFSIKDVEVKIRESYPELRLHSYILSSTDPSQIGGKSKPKSYWLNKGVYFLTDDDFMSQIINHALNNYS